MNKTISIILSGYRRPHTLKEQYDAFCNQTSKPNEILFWQNNWNNIEFDKEILDRCKSTVSNHNFGVWSRFAYALNCKSDYICIVDDDTIPGDLWLENCTSSFEEKPGLYGTIGLVFNSTNNYSDKKRIGWDGENNEEIKQVDIVGHSWFFHRDMLSYFWRELPDFKDFYVGEDMHFSFMLQKYSNLKTYVPPHPITNRRLWGSLKGWEYGGDGNATGNFAVPLMEEYYSKLIKNGFQILISQV